MTTTLHPHHCRHRRHPWMSTMNLLLLLILLLGGGKNSWINAKEEESCSAMANGEQNESCMAGTESATTTTTTSSTSSSKPIGATTVASEHTSGSSDASCQDQHKKCQEWADLGECTANPRYMNKSCQKSCDVCSGGVPKSKVQQEKITDSMGVIQLLDGTESWKKVMADAKTYMETQVIGVMKKGIVEMCKNEHEKCATWAAAGECDANPTYMKRSCAPVCQSCDYLTVESRCPLDPNAIDTWGPGDLNKMFEKLTSEPYLSRHEVQIHSSPHIDGGGPWVITMENVVTEEEALRLIELGYEEGYERSADVGKLKPDGTHERAIGGGRTSTNAWCQNSCYKDTVAQSVMERLTNLTGIDEPNSEFLQLLRYEPGQFYQSHHDYISHHIKRRQGVRILTVYLYLNDVPAGGGTKFDTLNMTIMPKRGRALFWPSVLDNDPNKKDKRTNHQALPVEEGIKYGANAWFHMRDFKTPNRENCM